MLTHIVHHIFRTARPTNFKLGTWMEDDNPHQPQAPWPPRSRSKVARLQGHVICLSRLRGRRGHTVSAEHIGHTSCDVWSSWQTEYRQWAKT